MKVADGTPRDLQATTGMHIVEVEAEDPYMAQAALHDLDWVASVTQLGVRLRVLIPERFDEPVQRVESALSGAAVADTPVVGDARGRVCRGHDGRAGAQRMKSLSRLLAIAEEGSAPATARPADLRHDRRHPGYPDPAIRLCHQHGRPQPQTAIADQAETHLSRQFVAELGESQVIDIVARVGTAGELEDLLRAEVSVGVLVPPDFERRVIDPDRPAAQLLVDGSDPTISGIANQLRFMPVAFDTNRAQERVNNIEVRPYYNPERRTPVNIIPGLTAIILTLTMTMFTAVAIVRERERGNLGS